MWWQLKRVPGVSSSLWLLVACLSVRWPGARETAPPPERTAGCELPAGLDRRRRFHHNDVGLAVPLLLLGSILVVHCRWWWPPPLRQTIDPAPTLASSSTELLLQ